MIKILKENDRQLIKEFAYKNEKKNLFIFWHIDTKECFELNRFFGYFYNWELTGLATFFWRHQSFVVNSQHEQIINDLVDFVVSQNCEIKFVPAFRKYAIPIIERLEYHWIKPYKQSDEIVLILEEVDFNDFSIWNEEIASIDDIDELFLLTRIMDNENLDKKITENERRRRIPEETFIIREYKKIVATANLYWKSKNYVQIWWVITHPEYRWKWLAKRCVSYLCRHYFDQWSRYMLLFTENPIALNLYKKIGFKEDDRFVIARY